MEKIRAPPRSFLGWYNRSGLEEVLENYLAGCGLKLSDPRVRHDEKLQRVEISRSLQLEAEAFGYSVGYCRTFYETEAKNLEEFWFDVHKKFRGSIFRYEDGLVFGWCEIGNECEVGKEFLSYLSGQGFKFDGRGLNEGSYSIGGNTERLIKAIVDYMVGRSQEK